jgi:hypothetical protein
MAKVMFGHPKRIETERLRRIHLLQPTMVNRATIAVELRNIGIENVVTELHGMRLLTPAQRRNLSASYENRGISATGQGNPPQSRQLNDPIAVREKQFATNRHGDKAPPRS